MDTYRNFISSFLQLYSLWYIHTATLYQFCSRWTRDDIYIPQLYINFPADAQQMIYTYRNFISTFLQMNGKFVSSLLQMNTWWYIHFATLYELSCSVTLDNIYIPQLYMKFSADEHVVIYTCYNFIYTFLQMNKWWYIHAATLYQVFCRWTRCNIYMLELYINFSADEHLMIYTYRNFISILLEINNCWYIDTGTLY